MPSIKTGGFAPADNTAIAMAADELLLMGPSGTGHELRKLVGLEPGRCLEFVRRLVELAHGWAPGDFYVRYGVERTRAADPGKRTDWTWWASDIAASLEFLEARVDWPSEPLYPGDLACSPYPGPWGHIGVVLRRGAILELVDPKGRPSSLVMRRNGLQTAVVVTDLDSWTFGRAGTFYRLDRAKQTLPSRSPERIGNR